MKKALSSHRVEAGLFAVAIATLSLGIGLIALPGNGFWGATGWLFFGLGLLCLLSSALLWSPTASLLGRFSFKRRQQVAASQLIVDEIVVIIDEGRDLKGNVFAQEVPLRVLKGWEESVAVFIETVLGAAERQRFIDACLAKSGSVERVASGLDWLRHRRDNPESWSPLVGVDVPRAIAVRREAWANVEAIDTPEIEIDLSPLSRLTQDRSTVFELGVRNRSAAELQDVVMSLHIPHGLSAERTTKSGDITEGEGFEEDETGRRLSTQIGPLAPSATPITHFSLMPKDRSEFEIVVKVQVASRPWLVQRFAFRPEEHAEAVAVPSPPPKRQESPKTKSPGSSRAKLDGLYIEGRRMLKATEPFTQITGAAFIYGPPPSEGDIDRWEGRVRAALPRNYRRRFKFGPLDARAGDALLRALNPLPESRASRRIKASLEELQRIMEELDEAGAA